MGSKYFKLALVGLVITLIGAVVYTQKKPAEPRLGLEQANEGREHIENGVQKEYKSKIPTSGPHAKPVPWGISSIQLEDENLVHNLEHGGVVISYKPSLGSDSIKKIEQLFSEPYAIESFRPTKAVVMPRQDQEAPIVLTSWDRIFTLDSFDQQSVIDYYTRNIGKSPEPTAN